MGGGAESHESWYVRAGWATPVSLVRRSHLAAAAAGKTATVILLYQLGTGRSPKKYHRERVPLLKYSAKPAD